MEQNHRTVSTSHYYANLRCLTLKIVKSLDSCGYFQVFGRRSAGTIETVRAISHTLAPPAVAGARIIFAATAENPHIQLRCEVSDGCREAASDFTESIVRRFDAKRQFARSVLLLDVTASAWKR